jgi:hypothetical protein
MLAHPRCLLFRLQEHGKTHQMLRDTRGCKGGTHEVDEEGFGSWPSGVQPRPLPKPPHNTPVLPPIQSSLLQQPSSPHTLTRTATGFNIDWKGGNVFADKNKRKEIEKAKKSCRESISIGTTHALEILSKSTCIHPVCPLLKRVRTSQSVQTSQGFLCPQHSKSIKEGIPPIPQRKDIKRPPGEPPQSWSIVPATEVICNIDSVARHPAARKSYRPRQG